MNQMDQARGIINVPTTGGTVVVVTGTAKKKVTEQKNKGIVNKSKIYKLYRILFKHFAVEYLICLLCYKS